MQGNPVDEPEKRCINTDLSAAQDAFDFFTAFFDAYPEFKKNEFFLTAESYGGTYIPMFMVRVHHPLCFALRLALAWLAVAVK